MSEQAPGLIFLVGYRGTGKSSVAPLLAACLGWQSLDADRLLEQAAGTSISTIFANEGEASFRQREAAMLAELCQRQGHVIATGGGIVLLPENRALLRQHGVVIWLQAAVDTIAARLALDAGQGIHRPALTTGGYAEIADLVRAREPLYRETAHATVETDRATPAQVADAILSLPQIRILKSNQRP